MPTFISESNVADILGTSLSVTQGWADRGVYPSHFNEVGKRGFFMEELVDIPEVQAMLHTDWDNEMQVVPSRTFTSVELFAGAGGLAIGLHKAGFHHVLLNEMNGKACETLRINQPDWNVLEGDVHKVDFTPLKGKVDFLSGGFPCQAFSYAGKKGGLNDTRGTLFFELARAVKEIRPKVFMGENVKGLLSHDNGRTLSVIRSAIAELGYTLVEPRVLKAIMYQVPQKRERLILVAIRNDIAPHVDFHWPEPCKRVLTLSDAFFKGELYDCDVPQSECQKYPEKKRKVMELVPEGGDWRDLPDDVAREYMGGSYLLGGGKTGMARRLAMDEPSLTLTCAPAQKQTERCHPKETRPLSVREYARIQTFPDKWLFRGTLADQYKQIGNAVPVNLAWAVGRSIMRLMNDIQAIKPEQTADCCKAAKNVIARAEGMQLSLDFGELFDTYGSGAIVVNNCAVSEPGFNWNVKTKHLLVGYVKADSISDFKRQDAKLYYTGKKFPSTVALKTMYYFMPYIKGKGIKDLYLIKSARVGTKREVGHGGGGNDYRLVFEIEFVRSLFEDYKPIKLNIWDTFTDSTLGNILSSEESESAK